MLIGKEFALPLLAGAVLFKATSYAGDTISFAPVMLCFFACAAILLTLVQWLNNVIRSRLLHDQRRLSILFFMLAIIICILPVGQATSNTDNEKDLLVAQHEPFGTGITRLNLKENGTFIIRYFQYSFTKTTGTYVISHDTIFLHAKNGDTANAYQFGVRQIKPQTNSASAVVLFRRSGDSLTLSVEEN